MSHRFYVLIILFGATINIAFAQKDSSYLKNAINALKNNEVNNKFEKVYLHLDKPYYAAGDNIWFKAYVVESNRHNLSRISGILNVELLNQSGSVEKAIKLPMVNGLTWGDIKLNDTIKAGYYNIRAYTRWMQNTDSRFFFYKTIRIINAIPNIENASIKPIHSKHKNNIEVNNQPLSFKTDVQFFPESGYLLYGLNSVVGFKVLGEDGLGKEISGTITDDSNSTITQFNSSHLGMGAFNLLPIKGKNYEAIITFADGSRKSFKLPIPHDDGFVMHIDNTDPLYLEVTVNTTPNSKSNIGLLAQSGSEVCYAAESKSGLTSFKTLIPKNKFPSGIAQFTLFSSSGEPLNERLVFIQNPDTLSLTVKPVGDKFSPLGKMQLNIEAKDGQGKPVIGNFSASIIDINQVPIISKSETSIYSNLLLTSDLKGYVEDPNYYFSNISEKTKADLDLLMLTQGYRNFEWKAVLANNTPIIYDPENSLEIKGKIKTLVGKPIPFGKVSLMSTTNGFFLKDTVADDKGNFIFKNLQFNDSTRFVIQSKKSNDKKNVQIEVDSVPYPPIVSNKLTTYQNTNTDTVYSTYSKISKAKYNQEIKYGIGNHINQLKEVQIRSKKPLLNSSNLNGAGNAEQILLMKDYKISAPTIASFLQGKLNLVDVLLDQYGVGSFYFRSAKMAVYVDGVLTNEELINNIPVDAIESVEVLTKTLAAVYGSEAWGGAILLNTKRGASNKTPTPPNIVAITPKGYYKIRSFYSPRYDEPKINKQILDLRTTIYWNPNVITDKGDKISLEYFNGQTKGTYRVIIEGIDVDGNLGKQVFYYSVE